HLPSWFPGASFERKAIARNSDSMTTWLFEFVKARDGTATACFCTTLPEKRSEEDKDKAKIAQQEFDLRWTANSMYSGTYREE
ncbi:hypothetical protein C8Q76DRAFT_633494, partial [Earliella scabrosa]